MDPFPLCLQDKKNSFPDCMNLRYAERLRSVESYSVFALQKNTLSKNLKNEKPMSKLLLISLDNRENFKRK